MAEVPVPLPPGELTREDLAALRRAVRLLENPGFVARVADSIGVPLERLMKRLPAAASRRIHDVVAQALKQCLKAALFRMNRQPAWVRSEFAMKALVAGTGAAGGALGFAALPVELPVTTIAMLRSIAEIARAEGEDIQSPEGALACLEVFAFGGKSAPPGEETQIGYLGVRAGLAQEVNAALRYLATDPALRTTAPVLMRVIDSIAARFGMVVSEKAAASAVPLIGAAGGAAVNALFMDHFQGVAHGHFTVRRLERKYGPEVVRRSYQAIRGGLKSR